ncbi:hypothetical protein BGZ67_005515 [Mortierella alpina]|nr:hypothetical protein BGZ67_005515 [Mortierella alpina]
MGIEVHISRSPDKTRPFICICGNEYQSRVAFRIHYGKQCVRRTIPAGYPGISRVSPQNLAQEGRNDNQDEDEEGDDDDDAEYEGEDGEEDEDNANEVAPFCNTNKHISSSSSSAALSFLADFSKALETTRRLQKQSSELQQNILHQLMQLHRTEQEHIRELRQELQEEQSSRRLMLHVFREAEVEHRKERSTKRLALETLMEVKAAQQEERQEWSVERLALLSLIETQQKQRQEDQERLNAIESRLKRSSMALGGGSSDDDTAPLYRTPSTTTAKDPPPDFSKLVIMTGRKRHCASMAVSK